MKFRLPILLVIIPTIVIIFYYLITQIIIKAKHQITTEVLISKLPNFIGKEKLLKNNTPSVFIAFHPDCEHCQYEAKSINEKQQDLQNINVVMFATASDSTTKRFSKAYGLDSLKNVHIIADSTRVMEQLFDVKSIPTIFIYNIEGKLVKQYNGETKIEAIIKALSL